METYTRDSDGKKFKVEYLVEHMPQEFVKLIPIDENPMPLKPHTIEILRRLDKLDNQMELLMNDRLKKQRSY